MNGNKITESVLKQTLKDIGCDKQQVLYCLTLWREGKITEVLRSLICYRTALLDTVHREQDKLECLDFLIYRMKGS